MKTLTLILLMVLSSVSNAFAADARLVIPEFAGLEGKANQTVNITLDAALIKLAAGFLDASKPEDKAAKDVISGLTGIYVKSFQFDADFVYPIADVERVRKQLSSPAWQRLVEVRSKKDQTNVDVYLSLNGQLANGLAIIASEPRQFTIVNIVGAVDLEKLHQLEGKFGIPKLDLGSPQTPGG